MPPKLYKKHPLAIRWFHWINFPVLMMMIWSGLLIYWASDVYTIHGIKLFPVKVYQLLHIVEKGPDGEYHGRLALGMAWHFAFMWLFAINGVLYVLYTAISGEWKYLLPSRSTLREALGVVLHDLGINKQPLPPRKFNGAQQIAYTSVIVMGLGSLLTGLSIYKPAQFGAITTLFGGYLPARFIHFWLTMGYVLFFAIHIVQVIRAGWNNFRAMITGSEVIETPHAPATENEVKA